MKSLKDEADGRIKIQKATAYRQVHSCFVCLENRIIIEVDGGQHAEEKNKDIEREAYLHRCGFKIIRFWNNEVLQNTNEVLASPSP